MKTRASLVLIISILFLSVSALAYAASDKAMSGTGQNFMKKAASGGLFEVEMGSVAKKKAQAPDIKKFGAMMVRDHSKANSNLKKLAAKKKVKLPSRLSLTDKATYEALRVLPGAEFDKQYMTDMVKDHARDVADFEAASKSVQDPDLKKWIDSTLPVLKKHLSKAKEIAQKMGIDVNKTEQEGRSEAGK